MSVFGPILNVGSVKDVSIPMLKALILRKEPASPLDTDAEDPVPEATDADPGPEALDVESSPEE